MSLHAEMPGMSDAEVVAATCPNDPRLIVGALLRGLTLAMVRRGESFHLRTCRNSHVNSQPFECSADCTLTQIGLVWGLTWQEMSRPAEQGGLFEVAG